MIQDKELEDRCPQCKATEAKTSLDGLPVCRNCGYVYDEGKAT